MYTSEALPELRWLTRKKKQPTNTGTANEWMVSEETVLQQCFLIPNGKECKWEWKDIPTVHESELEKSTNHA